MAAIFDFTRNAIAKVRSGHDPMSGMLGNPMVHTKVMILLPFYKKSYQFTVSPSTNSGHLGF